MLMFFFFEILAQERTARFESGPILIVYIVASFVCILHEKRPAMFSMAFLFNKKKTNYRLYTQAFIAC